MRDIGLIPYTNDALDALLCPDVPDNAAPQVSTIAVVGGLFDRNYNLFADDVTTVRRGLAVLARAGVTIAARPRFTFYNLLAPLRNDFLRAAWVGEPPPRNDLLITCGIWGWAIGRPYHPSFHTPPAGRTL